MAWLSELDGMIYHELVQTHEKPDVLSFDGYDDCTPMDKELMVPFPHTEIYQHYLAMQMDLANAELQKYQNDKTLFNSVYMTFSDYYTRTHMPVSSVRQFRL